MITISLSDPNVVQNVQDLMFVKKELEFNDEELQEMYDDQVKKDKENLKNESGN